MVKSPSKSEPVTQATQVRKTSSLVFVPGKGMGSYHCFEETEDNQRKLFRSAIIQYGSLAVIPNAEEALKAVLPAGFVADAARFGWTLKEALEEVRDYYASLPSTKKPQREVIDFDTRRLSGILASLSPNTPPEGLLNELSELVKARGEAAIKHLERMEVEAGRDADGFIYLRRVAQVTTPTTL